MSRANAVGARNFCARHENSAAVVHSAPPAQYEHPTSCTRFTPQVPDGITVIPGMIHAVQSLSATSGVTPAAEANFALKK